jgi:ABC-type sulfate/molybdate transport systems ATPase subunit
MAVSVLTLAAPLLDESFANLDTAVRTQLRDLVRRLHDRTGIPVVIVTHDREDVLDIADYLVVMSHGQVLQHGPTHEVFRRPTTAIAARLVGIPNILPVRDLHTGPDHDPVAVTDWGPLPLTNTATGSAPGIGRYQVAIPTDAITLTPTGVPATVEVSRPAVHGHRLRLRTPDSPHPLDGLLTAPDTEPPAPGDTVRVRIDPTRCHLLSATPPTSTHTTPTATTTPDDPTVATHRH